MEPLKGEVKDSYSPGDSFNFQVKGDPGAKVSLVAVDNAIFLLSKSRLTQKKVCSQMCSFEMLMNHSVITLLLIHLCTPRFGTRWGRGIWAALQVVGRTAWVCSWTQA